MVTGCPADRFGSACLHLTTGMGAAHSSQNQEPAPGFHMPTQSRRQGTRLIPLLFLASSHDGITRSTSQSLRPLRGPESLLRGDPFPVVSLRSTTG